MNPIPAFNSWHEFLEEEITVSFRSVRRIDVETSPSLGCRDEKVPHLTLAAQTIQKGPPAAIKKRLLVVSQAMQEIEHRIPPRRFLSHTRVVPGRNENTITDGSFQDTTVQ
jgi:hypothetical protein